MADSNTVHCIIDGAMAAGRDSLTADEAKKICDEYGISTPAEGVATSEAHAMAIADEVGYPVVAKIVSPDILHKSDAGGVILGILDEAGLKGAYNQIISNAQAFDSSADVKGVQIQHQLANETHKKSIQQIWKAQYCIVPLFQLNVQLVRKPIQFFQLEECQKYLPLMPGLNKKVVQSL